MPATFDEHVAHAPSNSTIKLVRRDDDNDGGLKENTIIGITIGLICFIIILVSFWFIWRCTRKRVPRTPEDDFREESLRRWMDNLGPLRSSRPSQRPGSHFTGDPPEQARRTSDATFSTYTSRKESKDGDRYGPSRPTDAHIVSQ